MYYTSREVYEYIAQQSGDTIVEWRVCSVAGVEFPIFQSEVDLLQKLSPVIA
jgi:vacuolar-type H+-ATPase subunit D/Vma8